MLELAIISGQRMECAAFSPRRTPHTKRSHGRTCSCGHRSCGPPVSRASQSSVARRRLVVVAISSGTVDSTSKFQSCPTSVIVSHVSALTSVFVTRRSNLFITFRHVFISIDKYRSVCKRAQPVTTHRGIVVGRRDQGWFWWVSGRWIKSLLKPD